MSKIQAEFKPWAVERHNWIKQQIKAKKVEVVQGPDSEDDLAEQDVIEGFVDFKDPKGFNWLKGQVVNDLGDMIKIVREEAKVDKTELQFVKGDWVSKLSSGLAPANTKTVSQTEKRIAKIEDITFKSSMRT